MDVKEMKKEAKAREGVERTRDQLVYSPDVDIVETEDDVIVIADIPGIDEKALNVTLEDEILFMQGNIEPRPLDEYKLAAREYGVGNYERRFRILSDVDSAAIQAKVKNGVLRVVLPKSKKARRHVIPIVAE